MLAHAYLFYGPEGVGKKNFAHELFCIVNGRDPEKDPDFKFITPRVDDGHLPAGQTGGHGTKIYINDIRDLKSFLSFRPYFGPYKFVVINDADRLETEASNAFLKMLEEPSPSTVVILISSKPKLMLPTILSRCETVSFRPLFERTVSAEDQKQINEFNKILKQGICERIQYAKKIYEKENYQNLVKNLIYNLQAESNTKILKGLLRLNHIVSQSQYNHRLAIENFLINL